MWAFFFVLAFFVGYLIYSAKQGISRSMNHRGITIGEAMEMKRKAEEESK